MIHSGASYRFQGIIVNLWEQKKYIFCGPEEYRGALISPQTFAHAYHHCYCLAYLSHYCEVTNMEPHMLKRVCGGTWSHYRFPDWAQNRHAHE